MKRLPSWLHTCCFLSWVICRNWHVLLFHSAHCFCMALCESFDPEIFFSMPSGAHTVYIGETFQQRCEVSDKSLVKDEGIDFEKDGTPLRPTQISPGVAMYSIAEVQESDAGTYECRITLASGTHTASVTLLVREYAQPFHLQLPLLHTIRGIFSNFNIAQW